MLTRDDHDSPPLSARSGIGRPVRRKEDLRLVVGKGCYSDDVNLPGQAYAVMVRSPHAHARIRAIDTASARTAPGVLAVVTGCDMLADGVKPIPHKQFSYHPAEIPLQNKGGAPIFAASRVSIVRMRACACGERTMMA